MMYSRYFNRFLLVMVLLLPLTPTAVHAEEQAGAVIVVGVVTQFDAHRLAGI